MASLLWVAFKHGETFALVTAVDDMPDMIRQVMSLSKCHVLKKNNGFFNLKKAIIGPLSMA